jgi:hypothetical protein
MRGKKKKSNDSDRAAYAGLVPDVMAQYGGGELSCGCSSTGSVQQAGSNQRHKPSRK